MRRFIKVADWVFGLKGKEIRVYLTLCDIYNWEVDDLQPLPSYEEISKKSRVKESKIKQILSDLEEYGFIDINNDDYDNEIFSICDY